MYYIVVILLTVVLPIASAVVERVVYGSTDPWMIVMGAWMVFWAGGVRLFIAGVRQVVQPRFTSEEIFGIKSDEPLPIVQELGFANLAMSVLSLLTIADKGLLLGAALVGGLYYGFAGVRHMTHGEPNARRFTAMVTDLLVFVMLAAFVVASVWPGSAI